MFELATILNAEDPESYRTPEGVYNLLESAADDATNYVAHYQRDALEFDYFATPTDPATVHVE